MLFVFYELIVWLGFVVNVFLCMVLRFMLLLVCVLGMFIMVWKLVEWDVVNIELWFVVIIIVLLFVFNICRVLVCCWVRIGIFVVVLFF